MGNYEQTMSILSDIIRNWLTSRGRRESEWLTLRLLEHSLWGRGEGLLLSKEETDVRQVETGPARHGSVLVREAETACKTLSEGVESRMTRGQATDCPVRRGMRRVGHRKAIHRRHGCPEEAPWMVPLSGSD